jgi:hypothetical protein
MKKLCEFSFNNSLYSESDYVLFAIVEWGGVRERKLLRCFETCNLIELGVEREKCRMEIHGNCMGDDCGAIASICS